MNRTGFTEDASDVAIDSDLFEMANLHPATTGLPMTIWVSPRGGAKHDVRIKVNMTHGNKMNASNTAVVGLRPEPQVLHGKLSTEDQKAVFGWVALNIEPLLQHWDGEIDAIQMGQRLRTVAPDKSASAQVDSTHLA